jgi:hypothetical protein
LAIGANQAQTAENWNVEATLALGGFVLLHIHPFHFVNSYGLVQPICRPSINHGKDSFLSWSFSVRGAVRCSQRSLQTQRRHLEAEAPARCHRTRGNVDGGKIPRNMVTLFHVFSLPDFVGFFGVELYDDQVIM